MRDDIERQVEGVREWYDLTAESFRDRYTGNSGDFWRDFEESPAMEMLAGTSGRILDLGCGPGRLASSLSGLGLSVIGADVAVSMVALARAQGSSGNVHFAAMDATRLGLKDASFDAVISLGMFEYLADPSPFLREIYRILRPRGRVVFTCHNRVWLSAVFSAMFSRLSRRRSSTRDQYYQTASHKPKAMLALLAAQGFTTAGFRGFHFRFPTTLYRFSERLHSRALALRGKAAAVALDHGLGRLPTRSFASLTMFAAQKP